MIPWFRLAAIGLLMIAPAAQAESRRAVFVRSGEHPGFSRLVFDFGAPVEWRLSRADRVYRLQFPGQAAEIDLGAVYQRIPRHRLREVSHAKSGENAVLLEVADDYHLEAFILKPGVLVVDVLAGAPPPDKSDETGAETPVGPAVADSVVNSPPGAQDYGGSARDSHHPDLAAASVARGGETAFPPAAQPHDAAEAAAGMPDARVLAAQEVLVEQLGRAMTQGIVELRQGQGDIPVSDPETTRDASPGDMTPPAEQDHAARFPFSPDADHSHTLFLDHLNFEALTVHDRRNARSAGQRPVPLEGVACLPDDFFEIGGDLEGKATTDRLGALRRSLIGEFDRVDPDALDRLIRFYVGLGFGAEAKALIRAFPTADRRHDVLGDLARIVETGAAPESSVLAAQFRCPGAAALWAILARPKIPPGETPDAAILKGYFADLPIGLRRRIGPPLAARLLDAGHLELAESVAMLISRAAGPSGPEFSLLSARLDLARGDKPAARAELTALATGGGAAAEAALIRLLEDYVETREAPPRWLIEDAASRAFQAQFDDTGILLRALEIRARALAGEQEEAFNLLAVEVGNQRLPPDLAIDVAAEIFLSFSPKAAEAPEKVASLFRHGHLMIDSPRMDTARRHVAELLLDAGLAEAADELAEPLKSRLEPGDDLLLARIYLALGRPQAALDQVSAKRSPATDALRLQALTRLRNYDAALKVADGLKAEDRRLALAWRGGRWDLLAGGDAGVRGEAARFALAHAGRGDAVLGEPGAAGLAERPEPAAEPSLSSLTGLLKQSRNARARLDDLFKEFPSP